MIHLIAAMLIAGLGSERYVEREFATKALTCINCAVDVRSTLRLATDSDDLERARRAEKILEDSGMVRYELARCFMYQYTELPTDVILYPPIECLLRDFQQHDLLVYDRDLLASTTIYLLPHNKLYSKCLSYKILQYWYQYYSFNHEMQMQYVDSFNRSRAEEQR